MKLFPNGEVAVVTGGSRGIGASTCKVLAAEGARVIVGYNRSDVDAKNVVEEIEDAGGSALAVHLDVSNEENIGSVFRFVRHEFGRIDVLIANAAITNDGFLSTMSNAKFDQVLNTNMRGTFLCCREAMAAMMHQRKGSIVAISSAVGQYGMPGQTNYSASKGAVTALTRALGKEAGRFGVRANVVAPGFTETDIMKGIKPALRGSYQNLISLNRFAQPDEIANVIAFVASDYASYMNAGYVVVDGGLPT